MRMFLRGFLAVIFIVATALLAIFAPFGQLTFVPLIATTALTILLASPGADDTYLGTMRMEVRTAPDIDWAWPTDEDFPWSTP